MKMESRLIKSLFDESNRLMAPITADTPSAGLKFHFNCNNERLRVLRFLSLKRFRLDFIAVPYYSGHACRMSVGILRERDSSRQVNIPDKCSVFKMDGSIIGGSCLFYRKDKTVIVTANVLFSYILPASTRKS